MATADYLLELDGIKGESEDKTYPGSIELHAASWGIANSGGAHAYKGSGSGKAVFQDLHFTKTVDLATTALMQACSLGKHIQNGKLHFRKAGGDSALEYLTWTLTDIFVSSITLSASGNSQVMESVSLNFAIVEVDYKQQMETGGAGTPGRFGYNIAAHEAA